MRRAATRTTMGTVCGGLGALQVWVETLLVGMSLLAMDGSVAADEDDERAEGLSTRGLAKRLRRSDFFDLKYKEGRKSMGAFVRFGERAKYFRDRRVRFEELKGGQSVWLFGTKVEREVPVDRDSTRTETERQFQNVQAVVGGEAVTVNEKFRDPKDAKARWHRVKVDSVEGGLWAKVGSDRYRVSMRRDTPVLLRQEATRGEVPKSVFVELQATPSSKRPETKRASDRKKRSYDGMRVIVLDRSLARTLYPRMWGAPAR